MTVPECLKPLTLSAVGDDDGMLRNNFFIVCKRPVGRDTINCQMPGPRDSSCNRCPVFAPGDLAAGIDSHITVKMQNATLKKIHKPKKYHELFSGGKQISFL